ncbi:protein of unknown function DUF343 [Desulfarculus baarsii DSM 2075]|jgi:uncharacterized protein YbaR (Trm112 family)|uniref:UPF0434 protein Deba_2089 n=1 Tax=Desulfarculus baarsii (strain ATCC 33931 / DSM 2075 / LMG 7858 / VKM B-1802 / 2st14) TaxID=644282 RepID=E1QID7_DESB2|nr:Trm112 family protein [Desulfarculus baarsii]ADK85454.1 protein of unknown function DUF343 [Desulfarculus baarsii DSM 2075]
MAINQELLELLVCPKCKGRLDADPQWRWLDCPACALRYEVRDNIPIMLVEEAKPLAKG